MMRALVTLGLVLSGAETALAQVRSVPDLKHDDSSGFLAEVRTVSESLDRSGIQVGTEIGAGWPPLDGNFGASSLPSRNPGPTQQIVSADSLRHRVPKAAKQSYERALKFSGGNNVAGAVKELEKAIGLDPGFALAHNNLGVQYAWMGRYQEAETQFRRTIELMPESSVGHANLALVLVQIGNRKDAELNLRRAVQLAPNDGKVHLLLGRAATCPQAAITKTHRAITKKYWIGCIQELMLRSESPGLIWRMTVSRLLQEQSRAAVWNGRDADQRSNTVGTTCIAVGAH
jgi:tetratricopeptide (TPR) repeat protein